MDKIWPGLLAPSIAVASLADRFHAERETVTPKRLQVAMQLALSEKSAANYFVCQICVVTGATGARDASIEVIEILKQPIESFIGRS